jgi:hypothetical protein
LGICYIRQACGEPPEGYELEIIWHEHDLGEYATIGVTWDGPYDAPWDYVQNAQDALIRFDQGVNWSEIVPNEEPQTDDENQEGAEDDDAGSDNAGSDTLEVASGSQQSLFPTASIPTLIELYRREEVLELRLSDWQTAVQIFKEMGWSAERPLLDYSAPLILVTNDEGKAMHLAGEALFAVIRAEPVLSASVQMDLGLFHRISEFVAGGAFIVAKKGAYAQARANGDF